MSDRTIFERIIDGEISANIVYETEMTAAFLDANPLAPGHTLVVPKEPYARLRETPPPLSAAVFETVRTLTPAIEDAVDADGTTIAINDGTAAGQEVPHLHVHVVPRFEGDGGGPIHAVFDSAVDLADDETEEICEAISARIDAE